MNTVTVRAVVQKDGELRLTGLPVQKGDAVEVIVRSVTREDDAARAAAREAALRRLLERAKRSTFKSDGPYPSRDELHERR